MLLMAAIQGTEYANEFSNNPESLKAALDFM